MAISVRCPNGHDLRVKDEFAGKSGLCPHCRCRIQVPMPVNVGDPGKVSDDDVLAMLGPGTKFTKPPVEEPEADSPEERRAAPGPAAKQEPPPTDRPGINRRWTRRAPPSFNVRRTFVRTARARLRWPSPIARAAAPG